MIRIETHDTILDIVAKMNSSTKEEILLEFPFGHPVLHNHLFLQILKAEAGTKRLTIITTDILSRKIWSKLWIRYVINEEQENYVKKQWKRHILKHNFTFFEYFIFETKRFFRSLWKKIWAHELKNIKYSATKNNLKYPWVSLLLMGLFASFVLLIFIFYFAVNKTYIYISPEVTIATKSKNFIYWEKVISDNIEETEKQNKDNFIEIKEISEQLVLEEIFQSKTIDYSTTQRSIWKAKLKNELTTPQTLRDNTRLLTADGIIFRTTKWITVPKAQKQEDWWSIPWEVIVDIKADLYDEKWEFIWERWNIEKTTMILPWLQNNRDKIYAYLEGWTSWWSNDYSLIIWEKDIEEAKQIMKEKLKKQVLEKIKEKLKQDNKENKTNYEILNIANIIEFSDLDVKLAWWIKAWDKLDKFKIIWNIKAKTYIYDKTKVINNLEKLVNSSLLEWTEKLNFLDKNSLRIPDVIEKSENPIRIKATTQIEIWINYDFENNLNSRVKKIKQMIMWQEIKKASTYLLNIPEIKDVTIKNSPFFLKSVSGVEENIIIKIKK